MDTRKRMDDPYKKKLQRLKLSTAGKTSKPKFLELKVVLLILLIATILTLLSSPTVCHHKTLSHTLSQWIWGGPDPRYISELDINWDDILKVLEQLPEDSRMQGVGLLNFNENEILRWRQFITTANHTVLHLQPAEKNVTWESLYPEWIDEEQELDVPNCPSLPKLVVPRQRLDLIAVKLPGRNDAKWSRDVARLHIQISAAALAASSKSDYPVHLLLLSTRFPVPNLFISKDLVAHERNSWLYTPKLNALREKLRLPIGSCELAIPPGATEQDYSGKRKREAYATILHSDHIYVCGAIVAAQSIRMAGSGKDLVILVDDTISDHHRSGLALAGWKIRTIQRIRNPKAEKDAYNEWNYSKFRLWQLTDYDKIIFIDADLLILKNIDFLFRMPEISATGNAGTLFNSGVMVIEPSNTTFRLLMDHINEIESYNGGDQGYLNEIFTWWHRIPRHVNFLKHFWAHDDEEAKQKKTHLFEAEPPILYGLHYLGNKPWLCYRDYDCNWNVDLLQEFASDVAHQRWWKVHDTMRENLQDYCLLRSRQKAQIEWDRRQAEKGNYSDGHWKIKIQDTRIKRCIDDHCHWEGMLRHWGETNLTDSEFQVPTLPAM
ncbi:UDP-glucuronate:xylan alpha-glucuronosyltransferase 1-like [Henckelia pumila]|uniref:UDP-glucuronate:xylan alpha-glucuronosyltransferase 1-like n=1 Tax=Henckelia pumila TaxID=405737 RepID=UPI003C6E372D